MNIRFKSRYLVLLLSLSVLFSCKKDDTPAPPPEEPTLFEVVQGRWNADVELPARISNPSLKKSKVSSKIQDRPYVTSVEFFNDSTYILVFNYSEAHSDKFSAKDDSTITFTGFGDLSDIKVAGDSISFSCTYYDTPLTVKAKKVADLAIAQDKKALLKEWTVTHEEDGDEFYDEFEGDATEMVFQFTAAGTFAYKISDGSESYLMAMNWKWHTEDLNSLILYLGNGTEVYNYGVTIKIVEISDTVLRVQMTDGENQVYNLKLVKK